MTRRCTFVYSKANVNIMKISKQIGIIFSICWLAQVVEYFLPFDFPATVIGMILLFFCLLTGILKIEHIQEKSDFLLSNMAFFFIPPAVSIVENLHYKEGKLAILIFICFVSIFTTFAVTAWTVTAMIKLEEKRKERKRRARLAAKSQ